MYYNRSNLFEYNECIGRGMCSIFPTISSFQEVMLIIFRTMSYYILKLEKMGIDCNDVKIQVVDGVSNLISTTGYSDEQLLNLIIENYNDLIKVRENYSRICKEKNISAKYIKLALKLTPEMGLSDVLTLGHRFISDKNQKMSATQKCYAELLFVAVKSVSLSLVKLFDFDLFDNEPIDNILGALALFNYSTFPVNKAKILITNLAESDLRLWKLREKAQLTSFGKITRTNVSFSTKPGKAILVSGSSLTDLKDILEFTKDEKIDIYTHGDLLIAHAFEYFKSYKNLKGHFGASGDNCVLDFATFPGAILLTKHATQNIEFLIRGRLFTTDNIAPKGVVSIQDKDFAPIVAASNAAKGFSKGRIKDSENVGFDYDVMNQKINKIADELQAGNLRHIFILGMSNFSMEQSEYFNKFLKLMSKDCYALSFSYHCECDNLLYINIANNFPLQLTILNMLFDKIPVNSSKITFFLTKCDANTISVMISLKESGAKRIYLANCPPTIINPAIITSFMKLYSIKPISDPQTDLKNILK